MSEGFLIMYSIDNKSSFDEAVICLEQIERETFESMRDMPCYLLGNKVDLAETNRQVTMADMHKIANRYGVKCMETSAKEKINVNNVMEDLALMVLQNKAFKAKSRPKRNKNSSNSKCVTI